MNYRSKKLVKPLQAILCRGDFYTAYPLREWGIVKKIRQAGSKNTCGELCSLRFTWQKAKREAASEQVFLYETFTGLLDAAWLLADAPLTNLHVERVPGKNNLFALAMFENEVAAEFELNECLPDTMPASHFVKANFTNGHISNQPLVGHFNEEGAILADESQMQRILIENSDWDDCGDEMKNCERAMHHDIKKGKYPQGALNSREIIEAVRNAVRYGTYTKEIAVAPAVQKVV
jgi:hypothetical protein